jgi:hypothetical protein
MNPFLILFKPLFMVATWIVTGIVAVIMTLGGKFEGRSRSPGAPTLTAVFSPAYGKRPPTIEIELADGELFRMILKDDPVSAPPVAEDTLAALGDSPRDSISALVRLHSDHGRSMVCRLSYNPVERQPAGVCAVSDDLVYDIIFIERDAPERARPPV